jgi:hypothetical protein
LNHPLTDLPVVPTDFVEAWHWNENYRKEAREWSIESHTYISYYHHREVCLSAPFAHPFSLNIHLTQTF